MPSWLDRALPDLGFAAPARRRPAEPWASAMASGRLIGPGRWSAWPRAIAFAGRRRQAEMVRAGKSRRPSWCSSHLGADRAARPAAELFRVVLAERALLEAEQAEARLKGGDERPAAGRADRAQGRDRPSPARSDTLGTDAFLEPARADSEMVRRLREAERDRGRLALLPASWRSVASPSPATYRGESRNPWDPQRTPGRLQRRLGRRGCRRPGPDRLCLRRRRLDPAPGLLRPLRGSKPSRGRVSLAPDLRAAGAGWRWTAASAASVRRHGALARRRLRRLCRARAPPPPSAPSPRRSRPAPGMLRVAWSTLPPPRGRPPTVDAE